MPDKRTFIGSCPAPIAAKDLIKMAHGGGGEASRQLIENVFVKAFDNPLLSQMNDSSVFKAGGSRFAFTTDSYVVSPIFFPGGDIGKLAVCGTVNDLSMSGARPLYLSAGFILEEGFPLAELKKIVQSMKVAALDAGVQLITGDTKVVDKGRGDGIYINTAGVGIIEHDLNVRPSSVEPGDVIIINGDIGRHGIAVMAEREGLDFETALESDCANLNDLVEKLIENRIEIHCMRDLTRGGLASALVEIASAGKVSIEFDESAVQIIPAVQAACEILGFDPLHIANEGRFICFVPSRQVKNVLRIMRLHPQGSEARVIGKAGKKEGGSVTMKTVVGTERIIEMLNGEQLPRIC